MTMWLAGLAKWIPPDSTLALHNNISSFGLLLVLLFLVHLNQVHPKWPGTRIITTGYIGFALTIILLMLSRYVPPLRDFAPVLVVTGKYWVLIFLSGHIYRLIKRHGPGKL